MFKWFKSLKIAQKILVAYGCSLGVAILGIGSGYTIASLFQSYADLLIEDAIEELLLLNRLEKHLLWLRNSQLEIILSGDTANLDAVESGKSLDHLLQFQETWLEFKEEHGTVDVYAPGETLDEKEATEILVTSYQDLQPWLVKIEKILSPQKEQVIFPETVRENPDQSLNEIKKNYRTSFNQFLKSIDDLNELVILEYDEAKAVSDQAEVWRIQIIIASLVLSVLIATVLALLIIKNIVNPLQNLTETSQKVTQSSNFDYQVSIETSDEIGLLTTAFNQLIQKVKELLKQQLQANEKLADYNQNLEEKVNDRTQELAQSLEQLQTMQAEIIQSEKMAALGHLVAGIAHEVNTPLGAIQASISNINSSLKQSLQQLPGLFQQLSAQQFNEFCLLLSWATQPKDMLNSREERQLRKKLKEMLIEQEIESSYQLADLLSKMNITESLDPILPLLKHSSATFIVNCTYQLASIQNNSNNINIAVERASKIVFALKSYLHQDSSDTMQKCSIADNIDLVLTLYQNQIKRGIEVIKNYESVPEIWCYVEELSQVWSNLIGNAIQSMNYQGQLKIHIREQDNYIVVEIEDSGSGIPSEIKEKIFEPFFTTKAPGEGSGLGLHLVRQIIEKHLGRVEFSSQVGHTIFTVLLPITLSHNHVR